MTFLGDAGSLICRRWCAVAHPAVRHAPYGMAVPFGGLGARSMPMCGCRSRVDVGWRVEGEDVPTRGRRLAAPVSNVRPSFAAPERRVEYRLGDACGIGRQDGPAISRVGGPSGDNQLPQLFPER